MEKPKTSTAAKVIAVILTALMLTSFIFLSVLTVYMLSKGYYTSPYSDILEDTEYNDAHPIHHYIAQQLRYALMADPDMTNAELSALVSELSDKRNYKADVIIGDEVITEQIAGLDSQRYSKPIEYSRSFLSGDSMWSSSFYDIEERFGYDADITIRLAVDRSYPYSDNFSFAAEFSRTTYDLRYMIPMFAVISFILGIVSYVFAVSAAGHRRGAECFYVSLFDRVPLDLLLVVTVIAAAFEILITEELFGIVGNFYSYYNYYAEAVLSYIAVGLIIFADGLIFTLLSTTTASRIKSGVLWKNNILTYVCRFFLRAGKYMWRLSRRAAMAIPTVWRTLLFSLGSCAIIFFLFVLAINEYYHGFYFTLLFAYVLFLIIVTCYRALSVRRMRLAGKELASGNLSYKVDTAHLYGDYRLLAEDLSNIGVGMANAVEERIKSERFKTELITNVSHDIKTPLTSIINYIDLLKSPNLDDETKRSYIDILDRQAGKLRRLTEDLIEASKASSGVLPVSLSLCDLSVLVSQTAGEYEERLASHELTLVTKKPDYPVNVMADGRHTARIFDNLMSNVCKYSLPGTRVYLELKISGDFAGISLRNISRDPVDRGADELTERFVRGDASRHTEGSGLGLSIAQSLAELQDAALSIETDSDLFRATLWFKIVI